MAKKPDDSVILSWLEGPQTSENDPLVMFSDNGESDWISEHSEHDTATEQSGESDNSNSEIQELQPPFVLPLQQESLQQPPTSRSVGPLYIGKDGSTKWQVHNLSSKKTKTTNENIISKLPGPKGLAKSCTSILDCWKLFITDSIIDRIVQATNDQLREMSNNYSRGERDCNLTDVDEMFAFIGVLYMLGVKKANHLNTSEMWMTDGTAPDFFRTVMSERRFHTLVRAIRFDERRTRDERKKLDNLSPIRDIFDEFDTQCNSSYTPGAYVTLDEMLEAFRGKCKFRQYISNKPDKYGVKIYALVDARSFYTIKMEIYAGRQPEGPFYLDNSVNAVVKRMITPIDNTGRNLTIDNYYTSVPLANELFRNHRTTVVGTLKKNKPQIPLEFVNVRERQIGSSMFGFGVDPNRTLLVSYVPKKNKNVLLLSTLHKEDSIDPESGDSLKPEVITFYNLTKGGVDVVDRLKKEYSVKRVSNRWPMTIFNGLLNLATVNAQVIYNFNTGNTIPRRLFIANLAKEITKPHLMKRSRIEVLPMSLKYSIRKIIGENPPAREHPQGKVKFYCVTTMFRPIYNIYMATYIYYI